MKDKRKCIDCKWCFVTDDKNNPTACTKYGTKIRVTPKHFCGAFEKKEESHD